MGAAHWKLALKKPKRARRVEELEMVGVHQLLCDKKGSRQKARTGQKELEKNADPRARGAA
jgi:hypothetical protein